MWAQNSQLSRTHKYPQMGFEVVSVTGRDLRVLIWECGLKEMISSFLEALQIFSMELQASC